MFQSVIVASKKNPQFSTADDTCILVPVGQKAQNPSTSDDRQYVILTFELNLQLTIFNWSKLSEAEQLSEAEKVNNIVRNALYADRYRDDNPVLNFSNGSQYQFDRDIIVSGNVQCANIVADSFAVPSFSSAPGSLSSVEDP